MLVSRRIFLALGVVCISLAMLVSAAWAGEPATVTVRVEGFNGVTLLPQTQVTTSTTPIPVESGSCSGTSAGGALYDATHGNWKVQDEKEGVAILGIDGVNLPPFGSGDYAFWALWVESKFAESGACSEQLQTGDHVVFVGQCFALGPECSSESAPDHFLTETAPSSNVANVGEAVSVTIGSLSTASGAGEATLPTGVTVTGGAQAVSPNAQGVATLSFPSAGIYTIQAHAPDAVPSDPFTICVHNGNDGTCGTTAPTTSTGTSTSGTTTPATGVAGFAKSAPYTGPYALVARATDLIEDHTYGPTNAPRVLSGTVLAHSAVSSISLQLRRRYKGRCYAYNGTRERFVAARCGQGSYFKVSTSASYSYLLPAALAPGRYVLDIRATDASGNHTTLARGSSRIVFYVR
jgi:hypothetical protein